MKTMFQTISQHLQNGEDLVLVTVVASSGSTPRGAGSRMLISKSGRICGTIGGGAVEYRSEQLAQEVGRQAEEPAAPLAARRQAPGIRRGVLSKAVRAQPAEAAPPQQEMPGAEALRMA